MRVLICGGRDFADLALFERTMAEIAALYRPSFVIEGGALGADRMARNWARNHNIPFDTYWAEWTRYKPTVPGRKNPAGVFRNQRMLEQGKPDLVIAFPGGDGTAHMVRIAKEAGVEVKVIDARVDIEEIKP